eukprot:scaffold23455_cov173-Cylindrotheca_fusiformis.AAC.1
MATLCFGTEMTGNNGYDGTDVLYLAFTGSDAVPGADGASWTAKNPVAFEKSISTLGQSLLERINDGDAAPSPTGPNPTHRPTPGPVSHGDLPLRVTYDFPLGRCEGDCDNDLDCQPGLYCFQRNAHESVPGCSGGSSDRSRTDYCVPENNSQPNRRPTPAPEPTSTTRPRLKVTQSFPLGLCEGDCDNDADCQSGLKCFQRNAGDSVPGCSGGSSDRSRTDYCIPEKNRQRTRSPTPAPVSISTTRPRLKVTQSFPLGLCEGDCDRDADCQRGMRCFQRDAGDSVPGCSGGSSDRSRTDYCIRQNNSQPTRRPTPAPVPTSTTRPQLKVTQSFPLGLCEGDCDRDADCQSGMRCFQRDAGDSVPGCSGGSRDRSRTDYCILKGGPPPTPSGPPSRPSGPGSQSGELVFAEEFNEGDQPNPAVWTYDLGDGGWGNDELQRYTNLKENVQISPNGKLVITALQQGDSFTSGRIKTLNKFKFKYGSVEASIKVPDLRSGLWPAFWTMGNNVPAVGWPKCGEIDMMEMGYGEQGNSISNHLVGSTAHWFSDPDDEKAMYGLYLDAEDDLSQAFHTFSMDWTPNMITTYLDGKQIWAIDISPDSAQCPPEQCSELHDFHFLLLNMAVGGEYTGLFSPGQISAHFPARYEIDYVRVYANDWTEVGGSYINGDPTAKYYLTDCGCPATCTSRQLDRIAEDSTSGSSSCRERIEWVIENEDSTEEEACQTVSGEFPSICGQACNPDAC